MRQNPHVRICGGPGSATTLVYPTAAPTHRRPDHPYHVLVVPPRHPAGPGQHGEDEAARQARRLLTAFQIAAPSVTARRKNRRSTPSTVSG